MKNVWISMLSFLFILCLLCSGMAVAAERYDWQNGVLLQDWESETDAAAITATNILDPINPYASREARNLYAYLSSLSDTQTYLTGLFDADNAGTQYNQLVAEFGYEPVVYSGRFKVDSSAPVWKNGTTITNSTCNHTTVEATCATLKERYDKGNILLVHADSVVTQLCSDILKQNKPDQYADGTNGIIELDCTNPDRDMQAYAVWLKFQQETIRALQVLENCGVKAYMWRPWIEFNYYDFCGVDQEGYDAFIRVYQQTVQMLIDAELTGFLVCFSPGGRYDFIQRNPGNDYVDTYGTTLYLDIDTIDGMAKDYYSSYDWYVRTGKPVGLTEWSCGGFAARGSSFDMASTLINYYPRITWTNFWGGGTMAPINAGGEGGGNDDGMLYMSSPFALTLDEVKDYRTGIIRAPGIAQLFDTADASGDYVGLEEKLYTAADLRSMGITANEVRALRLNTGYAITFCEGDNGTGKEYRYGFSQKNIPADTAAHFTSLRITRLSNVALEKTEIYGSVNDEGAYRANDGLPAIWSGDAYSEENTAEPGTAWLSIDLGAPYHVGRYVLKNASAVGLLDMYNTVDFAVQYSVDGEDWITSDEIKDNRLGELDCYIEPVTAQYFRVLITTPNRSIYEQDKGLVSIAEFELYGVEVDTLAENDTSDKDDDSTPETSGDAGPDEDENDTSDTDESITPDADEEDTSKDEPDTDEDMTSDTDVSAPLEQIPDTDDGTAEDSSPEVDFESDENDTPNRKKKTYVTYVTDYTWVVVGAIAAVVLVSAVVVFILVRRKRNAKKA